MSRVRRGGGADSARARPRRSLGCELRVAMPARTSLALPGEFRTFAEGRGESGAGEQGEHGQDDGRRRSPRPGRLIGRLVGFVRRGGGLVGPFVGFVRRGGDLVGPAWPTGIARRCLEGRSATDVGRPGEIGEPATERIGRAAGSGRHAGVPGGGDHAQQAREPAQRILFSPWSWSGRPTGVPRSPIGPRPCGARSASSTRSSARSHVAWYRRSRSPSLAGVERPGLAG